MYRALRCLILVPISIGLLACTEQSSDQSQLEQRVADLEQQLAEMQEKSTDTRVKIAAAGSSVFSSPLARFFGESEFWENTYDVGYSECSSGCGKRSVAGHKACDLKPEPEREACNDLVTSNSQSCQFECAQRFDPFPDL